MNINRHHIYFWSCFFAISMLLDYLQTPNEFNLIRHLYIAVVDLSIFYGFLLVLVQFKKGTILGWIKNFVSISLSFSLVLFLNHVRGKIAQYYNVEMFKSFSDLFYDTIYIYLSISVYTVGYYFLTRSNQKQKELRQLSEAKAAQDLAAANLAAHNAQLRQEVLELENNFLRAQINPHFLYNTLNTFYTEAVTANQPELAEGLLKLAKVMRYSLETTDGGHLVPLEMEVAHLRRVIAIHQRRFGRRAQISFTTQGSLDQAQMAPLVFITLLENALKHGEASQPDDPIALWLMVDAQRLHFTISNRKGPANGDPSHGIGLDNIKKRLKSMYGQHHRFGIEETDTHFKALLVIDYVAAGAGLKEQGPAPLNGPRPIGIEAAKHVAAEPEAPQPMPHIKT
jgi:two-component system, LytTR family, sensor kinase